MRFESINALCNSLHKFRSLSRQNPKSPNKMDTQTNFMKQCITKDSRRLVKVLREEKLPELVRRKKVPLALNAQISRTNLPFAETPTGLYSSLNEATRLAYESSLPEKKWGPSFSLSRVSSEKNFAHATHALEKVVLRSPQENSPLF